MKLGLIIKKQSGLSLIELLIAMFVGLFLLAGISTTYISSKKSSIDRDQYSILEDNGRIALEIIGDTLRHTGYVSANLSPLNKFIVTSDPVTPKNCRDGSSNISNISNFAGIVTTDNDASGW